MTLQLLAASLATQEENLKSAGVYHPVTGSVAMTEIGVQV